MRRDAAIRCHELVAVHLQVSQLNELLTYLGHEEDACTLQAAFDVLAKSFVAAAEELLALPLPLPPGMGADADALRRTAQRNAQTLQRRLWQLQEARWKWDALRPLEA